MWTTAKREFCLLSSFFPVEVVGLSLAWLGKINRMKWELCLLHYLEKPTLLFPVHQFPFTFKKARPCYTWRGLSLSGNECYRITPCPEQIHIRARLLLRIIPSNINFEQALGYFCLCAFMLHGKGENEGEEVGRCELPESWTLNRLLLSCLSNIKIIRENYILSLSPSLPAWFDFISVGLALHVGSSRKKLLPSFLSQLHRLFLSLVWFGSIYLLLFSPFCFLLMAQKLPKPELNCSEMEWTDCVGRAEWVELKVEGEKGERKVDVLQL